MRDGAAEKGGALLASGEFGFLFRANIVVRTKNL